jgi:hypothetical protein
MRLAPSPGDAIVGILQSSSMVSFMVLAFVGLGIYHEEMDGYHRVQIWEQHWQLGSRN